MLYNQYMNKKDIIEYWSDPKKIELQKELSKLNTFEVWAKVKLRQFTLVDMAEYHRLKIARKNNIKNLCDVVIVNWENEINNRLKK